MRCSTESWRRQAPRPAILQETLDRLRTSAASVVLSIVVNHKRWIWAFVASSWHPDFGRVTVTNIETGSSVKPVPVYIQFRSVTTSLLTRHRSSHVAWRSSLHQWYADLDFVRTTRYGVADIMTLRSASSCATTPSLPSVNGFYSSRPLQPLHAYMRVGDRSQLFLVLVKL